MLGRVPVSSGMRDWGRWSGHAYRRDITFCPAIDERSHDPKSEQRTIIGTLSPLVHEGPSNAKATCASGMSSSRLRTSLPVKIVGLAATCAVQDH